MSASKKGGDGTAVRRGRRAVCPTCAAAPVWYRHYDTFGCTACDVWTETPHLCDPPCEYFTNAPEKPSLTDGVWELVSGCEICKASLIAEPNVRICAKCREKETTP